jgi:hypothetical protein
VALPLMRLYFPDGHGLQYVWARKRWYLSTGHCEQILWTGEGDSITLRERLRGIQLTWDKRWAARRTLTASEG